MAEQWIKETMELIEDLEKQRISLRNEYEKIESELMDLEQRIASGHQYVSAYMNKHNIQSTTPDNIKPSSLADKSYPQMLVEIAKQSDGILNVSDATDILYKANVSTDKKQIAHNIYGALGRGHFVKIKRGQYRFTNHIQSVKSGKGREVSGVRQAVKDLKEKYPQMTRKDVLNNLEQNGFDFKGKKPGNAVNMAWVRLGYSREGKQQKLLIENPSVLEIKVPPKIASKIMPTSK
jgi:hypothetical protein